MYERVRQAVESVSPNVSRGAAEPLAADSAAPLGWRHYLSAVLLFIVDMTGWVFFGGHWQSVRNTSARVACASAPPPCCTGPGPLRAVGARLLWLASGGYAEPLVGARMLRSQGGPSAGSAVALLGPGVAVFPTTDALRDLKSSSPDGPRRAVVSLDGDVLLVEVCRDGCSAIKGNGMLLGVRTVVHGTSSRAVR